MKVLIFLAGCTLGALLMWSLNRLSYNDQPSFRYPVTAKLYRLKIKHDRFAVYQDWVDWHARETAAINATMEREKMYAEAVFRDTLHEPDIIYWLAISGRGGKTYQRSPLAVDKKHEAYMKAILIKGSGSVLKTEFLMLPPFAEQSIKKHQQKEK